MADLAPVAMALCWIAALYRLAVTIGAPATLWRWSFTVAMTSLAMGLTVFVLRLSIDDYLGVNNISHAAMHLLVTLSAGGVSIYLLTLRSERVNRRHLLTAVVVCAAAIVATAVSWYLAPFRDFRNADITLAPRSAAGTVYFMTWYLYLGFVLALTAAWCRYELASTDHAQMGVRAGLRSIGVASAVGSVSFALGLIRVTLISWTGGEYDAIRTLLSTSFMISLLGISVGTIVFLLGPRVGQWQRDRSLIRDLTPIGERIRQIYPVVALDTAATNGQRDVRAQRLVIEIGDGLRLLPVALNREKLPVQVIAEALRTGGNTPTGRTASDLLPLARSREDEYATLRDIAQRFGDGSS